MDLAISQILHLGVGILLSKLDIKDVYRIVHVYPEDWQLLGLYWKGAYYVDTRLPFGLRSAPKIFTALADAAQWLICQHGVLHCLHYPLLGAPRLYCKGAEGGNGSFVRIRDPTDSRKGGRV